MKVMEVETGKLHLVGIMTRPKNAGGFVMVWQDELARLLAGAGKLRASQWRVLLQLWADAGYGNVVEFFVTDLAREVAQHRVAVGRALRELEAKGLIRTVEVRRGRPRVYLLNPDLVFRGKEQQRRDARKRWCALVAAGDEAAQASDRSGVGDSCADGQGTEQRASPRIVGRDAGLSNAVQGG